MQQETIEVVKAERDGLKRELTERNRWALRPTALWLGIIGAAVLAFWYLTRDGTAMSMMIFLAGITVIAAAALLYFTSPGRFLQAEVSDSQALGNAVNLEKILSGMLIGSKGLYLPVTQAGELKVFIPATEGARIPFEALKASGSVFVLPKDGSRGLLLEPPGYGLVRHARRIGFTFSDARLETELRDVLVKGTEMAGAVKVTRAGDEVEVGLTDIASRSLCESIRKERPGLCTQIGCPVCSFVACAVAEGTGSVVRIENVAVAGREVRATFKLLGGN